MNQPLAKVAELGVRWEGILNNLLQAVPDFTLRKLRAECMAAVASADNMGKATLFDLIGNSYLRAGDFNQAFKALKNAAGYDPSRYSVRMNLGVCKLELGLLREAIADFLFVERHPDVTERNRVLCLTNLAEAHWKVGEQAEARRWMLAAIHQANLNDTLQLLWLANQHATIDAPADAAEFLARCLCVEQGQGRDQKPALEVIRSLEPEWKLRFAHMPSLIAAIDRAATAPDERGPSVVIRTGPNFGLTPSSPGPNWDQAEAEEYYGSLRKRST